MYIYKSIGNPPCKLPLLQRAPVAPHKSLFIGQRTEDYSTSV